MSGLLTPLEVAMMIRRGVHIYKSEQGIWIVDDDPEFHGETIPTPVLVRAERLLRDVAVGTFAPGGKRGEGPSGR